MNTARPWHYWLLWFVALASLALNMWLVTSLLTARRQAGAAAASAAQSIAAVRASSIDSSFAVRQELPLALDLPFQTTLEVPLKLNLPVNTVVTVPLTTPLGKFDLSIPISTTVPVDLTTQVPISLTVPIRTSVPVALDLPVHLALADSGLGTALLGAQQKLEQAAATLQAPLLFGARSKP
jgi:hypothetical protein